MKISELLEYDDERKERMKAAMAAVNHLSKSKSTSKPPVKGNTAAEVSDALHKSQERKQKAK